MTTFAEIQPGQIKTDCRFYTGYKPCHKHDGCPGCPVYTPRGDQALIAGGAGCAPMWYADAARRLRLDGAQWIVALFEPGALPGKETLAELCIDEAYLLDPRGILAVDGRPYQQPPVIHETARDAYTFLPSSEKPAHEGRILVIKLGAMGDVLRTKVILTALRRKYPEWPITWLTEAVSLPLVDDELVDEALGWTRESLEIILARGWQHVYCLDKDAHAVALSRRVSANKRFGFAPTEYNTATVWNREATYALRLGLSDELKFHENQKSAPEIVSEACALPYDGEPYRLRIRPTVRGRIAGRLMSIRRQIGSHCRLVGLNTGCGPVFATKAWPLERLEEFVRLEAGRNDRAILLLGGAREEELHRRLMSAAGNLAGVKVFDSGTSNSLEEFFALVEGCDAIATSDSLAMHVAVALRVPTVAWFGSTCHQEVDLYGRGEKIVTDFPCSPCYLKSCPKPVFCLSEVRAEEVSSAIDRVLGLEIFS